MARGSHLFRRHPDDIVKLTKTLLQIRFAVLVANTADPMKRIQSVRPEFGIVAALQIRDRKTRFTCWTEKPSSLARRTRFIRNGLPAVRK